MFYVFLPRAKVNPNMIVNKILLKTLAMSRCMSIRTYSDGILMLYDHINVDMLYIHYTLKCYLFIDSMMDHLQNHIPRVEQIDT